MSTERFIGKQTVTKIVGLLTAAMVGSSVGCSFSTLRSQEYQSFLPVCLKNYTSKRPFPESRKSHNIYLPLTISGHVSSRAQEGEQSSGLVGVAGITVVSLAAIYGIRKVQEIKQ